MTLTISLLLDASTENVERLARSLGISVPAGPRYHVRLCGAVVAEIERQNPQVKGAEDWLR